MNGTKTLTTRQLGFLMKLLAIKREILELKDFCKGNAIATEFADRIVRWNRRIDKENRAENDVRRLARMHDSTRDKGRSARRRHFLESTVTRFAERVGWPRQRVMARFLDEGVVDWLMRSVDNVKPVRNRETAALLRGRVSDAVNALEFYYRAVESMGNGERGMGNGGAR